MSPQSQITAVHVSVEFSAVACNAIRVLPGSGTLLAQWSFAPFSSKPKCSCPCLRATQRCALQRQWHTSKHLGQVFPSTPHHGSDLHLHSLLSSQVGYFDITYSETLNQWPRGPMDKASAYGAGDCRFECYRGHHPAEGRGAPQMEELSRLASDCSHRGA